MVKVTIFGLAATGKSTVSKIICNDLNLEYMSTGNMFRAEADKRGFSVYEFDTLCKSDSKFDLELDNSVKVYGKNNDNFIFESRLAWYFIPDSIKIKLDCDLDVRINRVIERDGGDFDESKRLTLQREVDITERYTKLYDLANFADDSNYDYVIDTTCIGIDEVVRQVKEIISENKWYFYYLFYFCVNYFKLILEKSFILFYKNKSVIIFSTKFGLIAPMIVNTNPITKNGIIRTVKLCPNEYL